MSWVDCSFDQENWVPGEMQSTGLVDLVEIPSAVSQTSGSGLIRDWQGGSLIRPYYDVVDLSLTVVDTK